MLLTSTAFSFRSLDNHLWVATPEHYKSSVYISLGFIDRNFFSKQQILKIKRIEFLHGKMSFPLRKKVAKQ